MSNWLPYLPNAITIGRMLAIIPLVWLMLERNYLFALYIAIAAGVSDALDGFLAKRFGWQGWLGGVRDPLADKFMMLCCYLVLAVQTHVPNWLFILILSRDLVIISGAAIFHFLVGQVDKAQPTWLSKINTALQILLILLLLFSLSVWALPDWLTEGLIVAVALFTFASGVHYVAVWGRKTYLVVQGDKTHDAE